MAVKVIDRRAATRKATAGLPQAGAEPVAKVSLAHRLAKWRAWRLSEKVLYWAVARAIALVVEASGNTRHPAEMRALELLQVLGGRTLKTVNRA